ncbi:MAG: DEAD/DEAH box helicase [Holosporales bacterium]|jgi:transcription-repair coupling factor (superfamily II helicase)|nr:DEAD/DEAH box helicase [Holosporales bacterium]
MKPHSTGSIQFPRRSAADVFKEFSKLSIGDYVVHERHGIAVYNGLMNLEVSDIPHDFLVLLFKNDDRLYVPIEDIALVSRYGDSSSDVSLDSLKGGNWASRKEGVKKRLLVIANNLMQAEAKRRLQQVEPFKIPKKEYDRFCAGFEYTETEDQMYAISDVIDDFQSTTPMDRLICGDVGFGKTEVALRAAFIAVSNKKQVVLLAPTTILVEQHFSTFNKRFAGFDVNICRLSRFESKQTLRKNIEKIALGEVQIIVGTHAVLSSKINFADLGLIIIDEEHHFGVKQKEKLRGIRSGPSLSEEPHFLALSATPIPRTLQMAMTGIRNMSLLATPPAGRLPVKTIICEFSESEIRTAIENEIQTGGQVFFVVPKVKHLDSVHQFVGELCPHLRIEVAHGKSPNLEEIILDFCDGKIDVLISTNIIDSGIDIQNVNTILIYRFELFGLAQLHQLRGRVGRSSRQAYAYFLLPQDGVLSDNMESKIETLQNLEELGSGFTVASQDLDIRGAGNLLGHEQSGYIRDIGIELYQTILREAILMVKAGRETMEEALTPQINIGVAALVPDWYIENPDLRLAIYRRIGGMNTAHEIDALRRELAERFEHLPLELENLLVLFEIQVLCKLANIDKLDVGPSGFAFSFRENKCRYPSRFLEFLKSEERWLEGWTSQIRPDHRVILSKRWKTTEERTNDVLGFIANLAQCLTPE